MAKIKQSQKQQEALAKVDASMDELKTLVEFLRKAGDIQISAGKGRGAVKITIEEGSKPCEDIQRAIERMHAKLAKDVRALAKEFDLEFSEEEEDILDNKKPETHADEQNENEEAELVEEEPDSGEGDSSF